MTHPPEFVDLLRRKLAVEITKAVGLSPSSRYHGLLERLFWVPTSRFAEIGARFDNWVKSSGFAEAARLILPCFITGLYANGTEYVPPDGPLLVTSNHPGICDVLVIAACLQRDDVKIVAGDTPFLQRLPSTRDHIVFSSDEPHMRITALRAAIRHLETGGALVIFPSGHIDPDPAVLPGGYDALDEWSPSVKLMVRHVPEARVLVTIVSGVLARSCAHNPLTWVRREARDRQRVGELLQLAQQMLFNRSFTLFPMVSFSEAMTISELRAAMGLSETMDAVVERARAVFSDHMTWATPQTVRISLDQPLRLGE